MTRAERSSGEVELGYVSGVFGVRGEVRLYLHHRESELLAAGREVVLVSPSGERLQVRLRVRPGAGRRVIGAIEGVSDPERAAELVDWRIRVRTSELPPPAPGEFYLHRVLGAPVWCEGELVGEVTAYHDHGPVGVFEVRLADGATGYVPSTPEHVTTLEVAPARLVLAPGALAVDR